MVDLLVGIAIFLFAMMGLREGIAKALGSVVIVFAALFLATGAINFLSKGAPQFSDPNFLGSVVTFLAVWAICYFLLDLLLTILLQRIIMIIILGPFNRVGGFLIGGFKGILICGIVLQLLFYFPLAGEVKAGMENSNLSNIAIATYQWVYPFAQKMAPKRVNALMKGNLMEKINGKTGEKVEIKEIAPEEIKEKLSEYKEIKDEQTEKLKKLLKDNKLLPGVPQ